MKTFAAIVALSAILLVGVHTAFAGEADLIRKDVKDAPAALYLPGPDESSQVTSDGANVEAGQLNG
jgi:hypothetical protein